ncbi:MAG: lamin tail domain-containing protein [Candidatus Kryptoniota bacterium]
MKTKIVLILTFAAASSVFSQNVKINELMYAPKNGEPEWIELHNGSPNVVNIKNWTIKDKDARWYTLAATDFYILPDSFLVLTKSDTIFSFHHLDSSCVLICPALPASFLVNTGDTITIDDSTGTLIDSVFYEPSWGGADGKSLERISSDISPFLGTNWGTSIDSSGSTPGRVNSIAAKDYDLKIVSFSASLSLVDSTAIFKIVVKNCGAFSTSPFGVEVFLDYDGDHVPQPNEIAANIDNVLGLNAGDSTQITLSNIHVAAKTASRNLHALDAFAVIKFTSDQDTTNNSMWSKLEVSYPAMFLIVNEIMYAPQSPECEWVELFNTSQDSIDLNGFTLSDNSNTKTVIASAGYVLPPEEYVVIAHDTGFYGIHPGIRDKVLIARISSLNNTGDVVAIHDECGDLIDSVNYSPSWGGNIGGKSLERILPAGNSNDPQNFETCADSGKSTPAKINSVTPRNFDLAVGTVNYSPCPAQSGESVTISASVLNRGLKSSTSAKIIFFNDKNGDGICESGEPIDSTQIPPMIAGDSAIVSFEAGRLLFGTYRFGLSINYDEDEQVSNNIKIVSVSVGLFHASVVINEIMYSPKPPEKEWIELYNSSDTVVDLSNFKIETHGGSNKIAAGSVIAPEDFAVICADSSVSRLHYPVKNLILESTPSLSNSGDWIVLYDNLGNILDSMNYVPSYGGANGKSLERIDFLAGDDSTNWHESVDSTGATPGMVNSTAILPYDLSLKTLDCSKTLDVNQHGSVNLIARNAGRNALSAIDASIEILSGIDGKIIFSSEEPMNLTLMPGDSATASFVFTPSLPGAYNILAKISQPQDQRQWNDTLSAWINVCYQPQSIVINEIMYSSGPMGEYFEIYNASQNPVDISNWTFHTSSSQSKPSFLSSIPKILLPENYFVVAADSSILNFQPDTSIVQIAKSLTLLDAGGCVALSDPSGIVVDSVDYLPSWHNSDISNTSGRSLEKINPALPSNDKTSWSTCVSKNGGTPGKRNSLFVDAGNAIGSISVAPNPFSPDGDGIDDFTFINYSFAVTSVKVRVRIFDSIGRLIATPVDNSILPSTGKIVWDGRDGSGKIVRFGLYILLVEMTGPDGKSLSTYKRPLVVAKKMK